MARDAKFSPVYLGVTLYVTSLLRTLNIAASSPANASHLHRHGYARTILVVDVVVVVMVVAVLLVSETLLSLGLTPVRV